MFGDFEIRELPLSLTATKKKVESFLLSQGLRMENLDRYFGIFDMNDNLVGGGGLQENVVKCIALSESTRNESLTNPLMSAYVKRQWPMATTTCSCSPSPKTNAYSRASLSIQWEKPTRLCFLKAIPEAYPDTAKTVRHSSTVQGITQRRDCHELQSAHKRSSVPDRGSRQASGLSFHNTRHGRGLGIFICRTDSHDEGRDKGHTKHSSLSRKPIQHFTSHIPDILPQRPKRCGKDTHRARPRHILKPHRSCTKCIGEIRRDRTFRCLDLRIQCGHETHIAFQRHRSRGNRAPILK